MLVSAANLDLENWNFDFGPAVKTEIILAQVKEAFENSLATEEPFVRALISEDETDLVISIYLGALGVGGPVYEFKLSEVISDDLSANGNDLDHATSFLNVLCHLAGRLKTTVEEIASEPDQD